MSTAMTSDWIFCAAIHQFFRHFATNEAMKKRNPPNPQHAAANKPPIPRHNSPFCKRPRLKISR
ncbi:hypothetical protein OAQ37_03050 [Alphaproteobacteria bacterium]|nr:hypothetical protein [Alphaproteobacteria bacterium]